MKIVKYNYSKMLPLFEFAIVAAIASCVASVTTDTSKGEVQSRKRKSELRIA